MFDLSGTRARGRRDVRPPDTTLREARRAAALRRERSSGMSDDGPRRPVDPTASGRSGGLALANLLDRSQATERVGEERRLAVLFAGITRYTPFAERLLPYDVTHVLESVLLSDGRSHSVPRWARQWTTSETA